MHYDSYLLSSHNWLNKSCRMIPFYGSYLMILINLTFFQLIFLICLLCITYGMSLSNMYIDYPFVGTIVDIMFALTIISSFRIFNIFHFIFGLSLDSCLQFHKSMISICYGLLLIHSIGTQQPRDTGIALAIFIFLTSSLYFFIKQISFELFYYFHILFYITLIPIAASHGAIYFACSSMLWIGDLFLRYIWFHKKVIVSSYQYIEALDVIEIKFQKTFEYSCGQYCYLNIPLINKYQYHPFSISSNPSDSIQTFHISCHTKKNWCNDLKKYILNQNDNIPMNIFIEGPYGHLPIDIQSYKVLVLICGGIGITSMASIYKECYQIHHSTNHLHQYSKVLLIWMNRSNDIKQMEQLIELKLHEDNQMIKKVSSIEDINDDLIFQHQIYVTSKDNLIEEKHSSIYQGRANITSILNDINEFSKKKNISRVGVFSCGPKRLMSQVHDYCKDSKLLWSTKPQVVFDYHQDSFEV